MSGEYINRETLRELMYTEAFDRDTGLQRWDSGLWIRYKLFENCLDAIPAADVVEVRHGRWMWDGGEDMHYYCSLCHHNAYGNTGEILDGAYKYCPSCGTKMDDNAIQHTECVGNALGELDEVEELSRYIDANKMADELSKVPWHDRKDEKQAVRMVKEFPAADVVEVVRCRECVHWRGENDICKGIGIDFSADGYCSEGKRKDGGQEK